MSLSARINSTLDIFFPNLCQACTAFLDHPLTGARQNGIGTRLCPACRASLEPCGPDLSRPLPAGSLDRFFSGYLYAGVLETIIPAWKYERRYDLFPLIAILCRESLSRCLPPESGIDVVMPVPLTRRGLRKRGFNQSLFIAGQVAGSGIGRLLPGGLRKVRETPRQATLNRTARLNNLDRRAFRVAAPGRVRGKRILVCDDVMTTGTTLQAVAALLRDEGAVAVSGFTLARVA